LRGLWISVLFVSYFSCDVMGSDQTGLASCQII